MQNFHQLPEKEKLKIFEQISARTTLPDYAVEKDWWVVQTLRIIFGMDMAKHLLFKGGTSLSKAWKLIDRFSEDVDLALDKSVLGIDQVNTKKQVKKLRSLSNKYLSGSFYPALQKAFKEVGFTNNEIKIVEQSENDPLSIEVFYPYLSKYPGYIKPRVLIEIGSRSLREPFTDKTITSFVTEQFPGQEFSDTPISIPTVSPERTFLEKVFLLHEEFQKTGEKFRVNRLSRHLYDLERILDTSHSATALQDKDLYTSIVQHRMLLFSIQQVDYNLHQPKTISLVPPGHLMKAWEKDYTELCESMVYGEQLKWSELMSRITELQKRINQLEYKIELNP